MLGLNAEGQLGDGTTTPQGQPITVLSGVSYKYVSTGFQYTCAINMSDQLFCWGENADGQLGTGNQTSTSVPIQIDVSNQFSKVYTSNSWGNSSTCAITTTGVLRCWGDNVGRQLGDGTNTDRPNPVTINAGTSYSEVDDNGGFTRCGLTTTNKVRCWGQNENGQIGNNTTTTQTTPVAVDAATDYQSISISGYGTCGVTATGVLKCWGDKVNGILGDGLTAIFPLAIPQIEYF